MSRMEGVVQRVSARGQQSRARARTLVATRTLVGKDYTAIALISNNNPKP